MTENKVTQDKITIGIAVSMRAASARLGIPLEVVRQAKAGGCPAFNSRGDVDLDGLIRWLFNSDAAAGIMKRFGRELND